MTFSTFRFALVVFFLFGPPLAALFDACLSGFLPSCSPVARADAAL